MGTVLGIVIGVADGIDCGAVVGGDVAGFGSLGTPLEDGVMPPVLNATTRNMI